MAGAKLAAFDPALVRRLPASDAPVAAFPGHRRGNAFLQNHVRVAALPQPPLPLDLLNVL
ncbi:MAG TPA: hypothetical protein VFI31_07720 [Pirellulales bacterium]|nr:hypothetical protein [Pirellulales bacterium]